MNFWGIAKGYAEMQQNALAATIGMFNTLAYKQRCA